MKKILFCLLTLLLLFSLNAKASTNTYERTKENGYGVNKDIDYHNKLENVLKTKYVDAKEKIYDFSDILTDSEEQELKLLIDAYYNKTGFDLVIVTDNLPYTNDQENVIYAEDFYDYNDFGMNNKYYSGLVFFRNTYEANPYYDMTLTGETKLYYETTGNDILDTIYSDFKNNNYLSGLKELINQLDGYYDKGIPSDREGYTVDEKTGELIPPPKEYKVPTLWMIIASVIGTSIFIGVNVKKNKMVKHAYDANNYLDHESINYTKQIDNFNHSFVSQHRISSNSSSSGGGFSSHTGSSGISHSSGGRHG